MTPYKFFDELNYPQAILLAYLLGQSRYRRKYVEDTGGWFFRTMKDVERDIRMSDDIQYRTIKSLKSLGLIDMQLLGPQPQRRHFKIMWDAVIDLLIRAAELEDARDREAAAEAAELDAALRADMKKQGYEPPQSLAETMGGPGFADHPVRKNAESANSRPGGGSGAGIPGQPDDNWDMQGADPRPPSPQIRAHRSAKMRTGQSAESPTIVKGISIKKKYVAGRDGARVPSALPDGKEGFAGKAQPTQPPPFHAEAAAAAKQLHTMLGNKNALMRQANAAAWRNCFRKFYVDCPEQARPRIAVVLAWYCKHFGEQFVPDARSAESFCQKFEAIEAAMKRGQRETAAAHHNGDAPHSARPAGAPIEAFDSYGKFDPYAYISQVYHERNMVDHPGERFPSLNAAGAKYKALYDEMMKKHAWFRELSEMPELKKGNF